MQTDVLQICRSGHVVTDRLRSCPEQGRSHCERCGAATLCACPTCGKDIVGATIVPALTLSGRHSPPAACSACGAKFPWTTELAHRPGEPSDPPGADVCHSLETLLRRLPLIVRQLRNRRPNRPPFRIEDEYDLEDLLRSLLPLVSDEVWPTVRTPTYSLHSRTDFVLPAPRVVVTAKLNLQRDDIEKQLRHDIAAYDRETRCDALWAYIFDPRRHLQNPDELERLWSKSESRLSVRCVISG